MRSGGIWHEMGRDRAQAGFRLRSAERRVGPGMRGASGTTTCLFIALSVHDGICKAPLALCCLSIACLLPAPRRTMAVQCIRWPAHL